MIVHFDDKFFYTDDDDDEISEIHCVVVINDQYVHLLISKFFTFLKVKTILIL